jgi:hypothetical protein
MLKMIRGQVAKNGTDTNTEATDTAAACAKQKGELEAIEGSLKAEELALNGEKVALETEKGTNEGTLTDKTTAHDNSIQAQGDYGNCAEKVKDYNNAIAAKYADIDGLTLVIGHLGNIDGDFRAKSSTE